MENIGCFGQEKFRSFAWHVLTRANCRALADWKVMLKGYDEFGEELCELGALSNFRGQQQCEA